MLKTLEFSANVCLTSRRSLVIDCRFASLMHLCYHELRMSAPIFMGGLWAVLAGTAATVCNPGGQCAVCESCKAIVCKVLG